MRALRRPAPMPSLQTMHIPAPIGGLNTVDAGTAMPPTDCPVLFNMISGEHGLRVRLGSREYGHPDTGVLYMPTDDTLGHTIIGYNGSAEDGSLDRLFVVTSSGIWNCTDAEGTLSVAFADATGRAGYGIHHAFVTSAGHFLLYCDEVNGYHVYTESTDTWAQVTEGGGAAQVSGVNPANLCFVTVWKSRVWFVEKDSKKAWYLTAGAIYGAATSLNLDRSAQFRSGGDLVGLWGWTLDGGVGIDDHLVAINRGGDVAIYQGTDPANASTFSLRGVWSVGATVSGRRIATPYGGDLLILSRSGPRPLSQLVSGGDGAGTYATEKVGNLFQRLAYERGHMYGWEMFIHPDEHALFVAIPVSGADYVEYLAMSLHNRSWSYLRDMQTVTACVWRRKVHFVVAAGNYSGEVFTSEGHVDFQAAQSYNPSSHEAIQWSLLTAFRSNGSRLSKIELIRPTFISQDGAPSWETNARYGYDLSELSAVSLGSAGGSNSWDVGTWDSAVWQSELGAADQRARGATGHGFNFAVALRGAATGRTVLVGIDVFYQTGGAL